jgi:transcriptional regulator with XRE-family HTH domain
MATPAQRNRLGGRLRAARLAAGLTLAQVQETSGVDKGVISRIETGQRMPSLATLRKLRDALHLSDSDVIAWLDSA